MTIDPKKLHLMINHRGAEKVGKPKAIRKTQAPKVPLPVRPGPVAHVATASGAIQGIWPGQPCVIPKKK